MTGQDQPIRSQCCNADQSWDEALDQVTTLHNDFASIAIRLLTCPVGHPDTDNI